MSAVLMSREEGLLASKAVAPEMAVLHRLHFASTAAGSAPAAEDPMAAMMRVYEGAGGLVGSDELMLLLRKRTAQPISLLARLIVAHGVVSFEWQSQRLLPLFQFETPYMSVRSSVSAVLAELSGTFDDREIAIWFATPNGWLNEAAPLHVINVDRTAVLNAARADRFIARG
jgi:hypothetical protein